MVLLMINVNSAIYMKSNKNQIFAILLNIKLHRQSAFFAGRLLKVACHTILMSLKHSKPAGLIMLILL